MTIEVYADELLRLTAEDIGNEMLIDIKDPENQTDEHIAHIRKLVELRYEKYRAQFRSQDEMEKETGYYRLKQPTPSSCSSSLSATPVIDEEEERRECWQKEQESYKDLVAEGGLPSHPIELGFDVIDNPDNYGQYKDILWFWHGQDFGYHQEFFHQLFMWRRFRDFQKKTRSFHITGNRFHEYESIVRESQQNLGCELDLKVREDRSKQNRLEDWNEFRSFYYRRLKAREKQVEPAERKLLPLQKEWEDARARLTDAITDEDLIYGRFDEIRASEKDIAKAESKIDAAEEALKAAKVNTLRRKAGQLKIAQEDLYSAKEKLKLASGSEELRRLRDGHEIEILKRAKDRAEGSLNYAQLEVRRWGTFLKWIDDQYPIIAAECGYLPKPILSDAGQSSEERYNSNNRKQLPLSQQRRHGQFQPVLRPIPSSRVSKRSKRKLDSNSNLLSTPPNIEATMTPQNFVNESHPTIDTQESNDITDGKIHDDKFHTNRRATARGSEPRSVLKALKSGISKLAVQKNRMQRNKHYKLNDTVNLIYDQRNISQTRIHKTPQIIRRTRYGRESKAPQRFCPG